MSEVKISVSDRMNELLQEMADDIGIKKSELVKSIVVEELRNMKVGGKK